MKQFFRNNLLKIVIPLLGLLVYANTFQHGYTLDDIPIIEENQLIRKPGGIPDLFTTHYWAGKPNANDKGLYRPLTMSTYAIQYRISGDNPHPFHWVNALLHALVCLMIILVLKRLFRSDFIAFGTAGIFAVHPIHTEAVAGIVGRAELLSLLFILLAIYLFRKADGQKTRKLVLLIAGAIVAAIAAALSKELGFLTPAFILFSYAERFTRKMKLEKYTRQLFGLITMSFFMMAFWAYRATVVGNTVAHELWREATTTERIATGLRTCLEYAGMLIFPASLSADYWSTEVPFTGFGNPLVWLALLLPVIALGTGWVLRQKSPAILWGVLFFGITLFPVSNIPFAIGVLKAERILYAPSFGFITALFGLLYMLFQQKKYRTWITGLVILYGLVLASMTWKRNPVWENNFTLSRATVVTSPQSPRMNNILGQALKKQGKDGEALFYLEQAVRSRPQHLPAVVNLALMKKKTGDITGAVRLLEMGLQYNPNHFEAGANLIGIYRSTGQLEKARILGERFLKIYPNSPPVMINLGNVYYDLGQMNRAQQLWNAAKGKK